MANKLSMLLPLLLCLGLAAPAWPQADVSTATLRGTVTDPTGAVIAGATVTARSVERGISRTTTGDGAGVYQFLFLPPGTYEIRAEASGFKTGVVTEIVLTVGQVANQIVQLSVGAVTEEIAVRETIALVEPERTQQANTVGVRQIENVPNVSRDFTAYVFTVPGVSSSSAPRAQNPGFTFGSSGFSIGGSNGRNNLVTIDGGENEYGSGQLRVFLSVEAVQEFQVNRNAFAAEFGFTAGTAVNVVTRSGSNDYHGSGYVFYRSQKTSARNFFDLNRTKAFDQQIYPGFTFGGPIARNKLFVFTSYEMLKSDAARFRAYTNNPAILDPTAAQADYLARLDTAADTNIRRIGAGLRGALNTRNFPDTMKLLTQGEGTFTALQRFHIWTTRLDWQAGPGDTVSARFSLQRNTSDQLGTSNAFAPSNSTDLFTRDYTAVGTWTHNFSASVFNQFRAQFAPNNSARTISKAPQSTGLVIPGVATFGRIFSAPFNTFQDRYQFDNIVSWSRGKHLAKFGASYRPVNYHVINELWFGGLWNFASGVFPAILAAPAADQAALVGFNRSISVPDNGPPLASLSALQSLNLGVPFLFRQGFGNPDWKDWAHFLGTFAQDSWKVTPRIALDLGVRFDFDREPQPLGFYKSVSPRAGFAWDLFGDQKTVIRGGSGLFYSPVYYQVAYVTNLLNDSGRYINQIFRTPAFPAAQTPAALWARGRAAGKLPFTALNEADLQAAGVATGRGAAGRVLFDADPNYENNYSVQASFGISRHLTHDLNLEVAWQVYRGVHLQLPHERNYVEAGRDAGPGLGPQLVPIDPTITQKNIYSSIGNSIYHGLTSSLTKRFSRHSQFQINYTFSKTIDDVTDFNSAFAAFIPTRLNLERGLSAFDIRHNFVASGVLTSPFQAGAGHHPLARAFADITLSPVILLRSGIPFTVRIGSDTNGDTHGDYDRPFAASRNTGLGENFYGVDMRLAKQLYVNRDKGLRLDFISEATNLFNHANFLAVNDVVGRDPNFLFGPFNLRGGRNISRTSPLGFTTTADPRRIQFALKIVF